MNQQFLKRFKGTGVALVTPFKDGKIDLHGFEKVINHVIDGKIDFLVPLGTTGESATLNEIESRLVLESTITINKGRLPIVAGHFGSNDTHAICNKIKRFDFTGVDAILSSSPSYNKPTQEGIFQHYIKIAECSPVPIIIYNVPGRTSSYIQPETILKLAQHSTNFIAVKDASGNIVDGSKIAKDKPDHFLLLSGDDPTCLGLLANGGDGVISVIANAYPKQFSDMVKWANRNDFTKARVFHHMLLHLHHWLYLEGNPAGVKATLELMGICNRDVKLPLVPYSSKNLDLLKKAIEAIPSLHEQKV